MSLLGKRSGQGISSARLWCWCWWLWVWLWWTCCAACNITVGIIRVHINGSNRTGSSCNASERFLSAVVQRHLGRIGLQVSGKLITIITITIITIITSMCSNNRMVEGWVLLHSTNPSTTNMTGSIAVLLPTS
jgi:hypothetical protein